MARIVNFTDGAESETTPTIGNIVASDLVNYPDDATYEATEQGAPDSGNIYFNTTLNLIRYYNGTEWISLVDTSSTQTLTSKSIDADTNTITNIANDEIAAAAAIDATKIHDGSVDNTEFGHLDGVSSNIQTQLDAKQNTAEKGVANGYASLDGSGLVPTSQLPLTDIDNVDEFPDFASFPPTGVTDRIYITADTNQTYRWTGSVYVEVGSSVAELSDLTDADTTGVQDGDVLIYNNANSRFEPGTVSTQSQESIAFVGFGTASWDSGTSSLTLSDDCFISVPGLVNDRHRIAAQTITISNGIGAYVTIDRNATSPTTLTVQTAGITSVPTDNDTVVIARVNSNTAHLGIRDPQRIDDGDTADIQKIGNATSQQIYNTTNWIAYTPTITGTGGASTSFVGAFYRRLGDSIEVHFDITFSSAGSGSSPIDISIPSGLQIDGTKLPTTVASFPGRAAIFRVAGQPGYSEIGLVAYQPGDTIRSVQPNNSNYLLGQDITSSDKIAGKITLPIVGYEASTLTALDTLIPTTFNNTAPMPTLTYNSSSPTGVDGSYFTWRQVGNIVTIKAGIHYTTPQTNSFMFLDMSTVSGLPLPIVKTGGFQNSWVGSAGVGNGGSLLSNATSMIFTQSANPRLYINTGSAISWGEWHLEISYEVV